MFFELSWKSIIYAKVAVFLLFYIGCRLRFLPIPLQRFWFGLVFLITTIWMNLGSGLIELTSYLGVAKVQREILCTYLCKFTFSALIVCNPQIRVKVDETKQKLKDIVPRSMVAVNHVSFMDAFVFVYCMPLNTIWNCRTMMKATLMDIPIFGSIFERVGHFPVYFKSEAEGNFSVEKEKMAPVMERVKKHIESGGRLTMFPEGIVNKTPKELRSFRIGAFNTVIEHKLPLYYVITNGNEDAWPHSAKMGGFPATITLTVNKFPDVDFENEDPKLLSEKLRTVMQAEVDRLYASRKNDK